MKITTRCGEQAVAGLNEALLAKAVEAKLLRTDKVRADTTVVPAAVGYPTDSGLLAKAIGTMARTVERVRAAGGATVVTTVLAHQATSTGAGKLRGAHPRER